jgi:site-specific DNA-methyltransferase (adenine-specific)
MTTLTLLNGDCLEIMKTLSDKSVDCFICDLPYGCLASKEINVKRGIEGYSQGGKAMSACAWDIKLNLELFWVQIKRLRKNDHTPCLMFCTTKFGYDLIKSNEKEFRYDLVWDKQRGVSFLSANKMPMRSHEMIYVFSKAGAYYNRVDIDDKNKKAREENISDFKERNKKSSNAFLPSSGKLISSMPAGKRCILSVINNNTSFTRNGHPTEKPMALYKFLIERYCVAGGTILDPTAGSFNSCFCAYELNRSSIGIEKDDKFFKKASDRADLLSG